MSLVTGVKNVQEQAKSLVDIMRGKKIPAWAPIAFGTAAAAPIVGYELAERNREEERQREQLKEFMQAQYNPPAIMRRDLRRNEAAMTTPLSAETDETATPRSGGQSGGPGGTLKSACDLNKIKDALQTLKARRDSTPRGAPLRAGAHKLAKD